MSNSSKLLYTLILPSLLFAQSTPKAAPETMTKMVVRLLGPDVKPGSYSALPKTIYRAAPQYARIEDAPDARQKTQKLTIIVGADAYSANLIDKTGTHATGQSGPNGLHLPIVLPFDPKRRLPNLDRIEFGGEFEFFQAAGAAKEPGPIVNSALTDAYNLKTPEGNATLVVKPGSETPITLSWHSNGSYRYEYITYEDVPFQPELFTKPKGIAWKEMPPDPDAGRG